MPAKRFTNQVGIGRQDLSTGFVQGSNSLRARLQEFSQVTKQASNILETQRGQEEAREAIAEGKAEPGKFKTKEAGTMERMLTGGTAAKAYNKTLETAYLASLGQDIQEQINEYAVDNVDDIIKFNNDVAGYLNGLYKEVDPSVLNDVKHYAEAKTSQLRMEVHRNTINKNEKIATEEIKSGISASLEEAERLALAGNVEGAKQSAFQAHLLVDRLFDLEHISKEEKKNSKHQIDNKVYEQSLRFEGRTILKGKDGESKFVAWLHDKTNNPTKNHSVDEWGTLMSTLTADFTHSQALSRGIKIKNKAKLKEAYTNFTNRVKSGFKISPEEYKELEKQFKGTPYEKGYHTLRVIQNYSLLSNEEKLQAKVDILKKEKPSTTDMMQLEAFRESDAVNLESATKNGLSHADKQGIINLGSLDWGNLKESFRKRAIQAEIASEYNGVDMLFLTPEEINQISAKLESGEMTVNEQVTLVRAISNTIATMKRRAEGEYMSGYEFLSEAFDVEYALNSDGSFKGDEEKKRWAHPNPEKIWELLSKKGHGNFAMAGSSKNPNVSELILRGNEKLKQGIVKIQNPPSTEKSFLAETEDYLGDIYAPIDVSRITSTAKAIYAQVHGNEDYNKEMWRQSLALASGGVEIINGHKVAMSGQSRGDFAWKLGSIRDDDKELEGGFLFFTNHQAVGILNSPYVKFVQVGDNEYWVELRQTIQGGQARPEMLLKADGSPYTFYTDDKRGRSGRSLEELSPLTDDLNYKQGWGLHPRLKTRHKHGAKIRAYKKSVKDV